MALIRFTASMKRLTTTGARPSNGSSSSRIDGRERHGPADRHHLLLAAREEEPAPAA